MGGFSIHEGVHGVVACSHHSIEGWNLGSDVCYVLEEGARMAVSIDIFLGVQYLLWLAISKRSHDNIQGDYLIWLWKERHLVIWDESSIVKIVEFIDQRRSRQRLCIIVYKPASDVPVQAVGNLIEQ
jgi:hypothetical protein